MIKAILNTLVFASVTSAKNYTTVAGGPTFGIDSFTDPVSKDFYYKYNAQVPDGAFLAIIYKTNFVNTDFVVITAEGAGIVIDMEAKYNAILNNDYDDRNV